MQRLSPTCLSKLPLRMSALVLLLLVVSACAQIDKLDEFRPSVVSTKTDFETISEYAAYAQAAYLPKEEIRRLYPNAVRINAPEGTKTLYFLDVSSKTKTQTISVRGTKTLHDVLLDIEFAFVSAAGIDIPIHKGFQKDALLIYADMKPYLRRDYQTRLTGHSLGAAVSTILMIYLKRDGFPVQRSINFGQPKFTNKAGAELYKDLPVQRVVDVNDVVPMLPPSLVTHPRHGKYAHIGEEVVLLEGRFFVRLNEHDSERISINQFWRERKIASSEDHHMENYSRRIESKQESAKQLSYREWKENGVE